MPLSWPDYELIDFGEGRKLERYGAHLFDRPAPAAAGVAKTQPAAWKAAQAKFVGERAAAGEWRFREASGPAQQTIDVPLPGDRSFRMTIDTLPSGQVGLFPEQWPNWQWLAQQVDRVAQPLNVLNLFAYTGGSTLATASAPAASVAHVDAARSMVTLARANAAASGLAEQPIRWIVEDALSFCRREAKRGRRYDAVILDPPTYGHGPKGQSWNIKRDLLPLLKLCGDLTERRPKFVLLTCHTPGLGAAELSAYLAEGIFGHCGQPPRTGELLLATAAGRRLPSGAYARWPG